MKPFFASVCALVMFAVPAAAQTHVGSTRPAQDRPGIIAFGSADSLNLASSQTFNAVFGKSKLTSLGGGLDVVNVWRHVFVRVAASKTSLDGQRVVIVNSTVYKLGTALTMDMTPTEIGAGWRFVSSNPGMRFTPYFGASLMLLDYKETSTFADASENVSETFKGVGAFGGVDVRITSQIIAGVEAQYRSINSNPAANSAAATFNENNLGGTALRVRLGFRF
jgi:hypothetical protein